MVAPSREPNRQSHAAPRSMDAGAFAQRVLVTVAIASAAVILALIIWYTFWVWLLASAGILLAVFLRALMIGIRKLTRLPEGWSMAAALVLLLAAIVGGSFLLAPRLAEQIDELRVTLPEAMETFVQQAQQYELGAFAFERVGDLDAEEFRPMLAAGAATFVTNIFAFFIGILVVLFIGLYLAINPKWYIDGALRLLAPPKRPRMREVFHNTGRMLMWWLLARIVAMAFVGITCAIGLLILGVPLAFTLGFIAGLLDFVPNIGPFIAAAPAVLIAFAERPQLALYVIVLYFVVQQLESYVVTPIVQQHVIRIPPALTVFVQVLFFLMAGILGLFLATPITVAAIVLLRELYVKDTLGDQEDEEEDAEPRARATEPRPVRRQATAREQN